MAHVFLSVGAGLVTRAVSASLGLGVVGWGGRNGGEQTHSSESVVRELYLQTLPQIQALPQTR